MPIYGYGVTKAPWIFCKTLTVKKLIKFINIFKSVETEFKLDPVFLKSITYNSELKGPFIASYDLSKTNINAYIYQTNIEKLVSNANKILSKNRSYDNYKFDIMGTWTIGKIIVMEKK